MTADRILGLVFAHEPHCVYCGLSLYRGRLCGGCSDLPGLDDEFTGWTLRRWWLDRHSLADLADIARGLEAAAA